MQPYPTQITCYQTPRQQLPHSPGADHRDQQLTATQRMSEKNWIQDFLIILPNSKLQGSR